MQIQTLSVGPIGTLCYLISAEGAETCAVIDPGAEAARIRKAAGGRRIEAILLTHGHFDHIGAVGELMEEGSFPIKESLHTDCGLCVFDPEDDVHAGASGCGCSASVLSAMILPKLQNGEWQRVLFGETIPGVAHAVVLEGGQ